MTVRILEGDCRAVMATLPDASVDSIVCDPPYELGFMGKKWDASGIAYDPVVWRQALRVLKPGGHLLAFSGSRTYHRMVCAIEDAGFEIRDQLMWLYGSGFPKSLDVSKAIDKSAGAEREVLSERPASGIGANGNAFNGHSEGATQKHTPNPVTAAAAWQGWGTALKPAHEPIVMARKPLIGTVAANVLAHGTGALNIEACRVEAHDSSTTARKPSIVLDTAAPFGRGEAMGGNGSEIGRWPANVLHDGSDEVVAAFPQQGDGRKFGAREAWGSAARFFYTAKASRFDRNDGMQGMEERLPHPPSGDGRAWDIAGSKSTARANHHPTVKPTELMRYLVRLVTPQGGTVLDPFMGSGSTLKAAEIEQFNAIGIELDPEYAAIARRRIGSDAPLFAEVA